MAALASHSMETKLQDDNNVQAESKTSENEEEQMLKSLQDFFLSQARRNQNTTLSNDTRSRRSDSFLKTVMHRLSRTSSTDSGASSSKDDSFSSRGSGSSTEAQRSGKRLSLFRRKSSGRKVNSNTKKNAGQNDTIPSEFNWKENLSLALDLVTSHPACLTDILLADDEVHENQLRRALAAYAAQDLLQNVETNVREQRCLAVLLEELIAQDFRACAENGSGPQSALRDNSSGAVLLLSSIVRREDNQTLLNDFLDQMLNKDKNVAQDAHGLAIRILQGLEGSFKMSVSLAMINDQIFELAPETEREKLLGGFFLLRVINPLLVSFSTQQYDQRTLIDTARVLQNMANGSGQVDPSTHLRMAAFLRNSCFRQRS